MLLISLLIRDRNLTSNARMSYIVFAWLTTIVYGLGGVVGKIATKHHIENPWLYNALWVLLTVLYIAPLAMFNNVGLPQDWGSMVWLGIANAVSGIMFVLAFYAVDLTVLAPLSNIRTPFVALLGVLWFGEQLSFLQWALIGAVFVAGMVIHIDERMSIRSFWTKGMGLVLLWIPTSVWFNTMVKRASQSNGYWEVALWSNILALLLILPTVPLFYRDLSKIHFSRYYTSAFSIVLWTAGLLFSVKALGENVSITMAIMSLPLSMVFTMALSVFWPKLLEKHTLKVYAIRFVAASVMFAAALGLSK